VRERGIVADRKGLLVCTQSFLIGGMLEPNVSPITSGKLIWKLIDGCSPSSADFENNHHVLIDRSHEQKHFKPALIAASRSLDLTTSQHVVQIPALNSADPRRDPERAYIFERTPALTNFSRPCEGKIFSKSTSKPQLATEKCL